MVQDRDFPVGEYFGIPHFAWDVISRVVPGMAVLAVVWGFVIGSTQAHEIQDALHHSFTWWLPIVGLAYLVGQVADCLPTYRICNWFARRHMRHWQKKLKPLAERLRLGASELFVVEQGQEVKASWDTIFTTNARNKSPHPESVYIMKSQIESRCLMNLSVLLVASVIVAAITFLAGGQSYTLVGSKTSVVEFWFLLPSIFVFAVLSFLASGNRQGRRVVGMINVFLDTEKDANPPVAPPRDPQDLIAEHLGKIATDVKRIGDTLAR